MINFQYQFLVQKEVRIVDVLAFNCKKTARNQKRTLVVEGFLKSEKKYGLKCGYTKIILVVSLTSSNVVTPLQLNNNYNRDANFQTSQA